MRTMLTCVAILACAACQQKALETGQPNVAVETQAINQLFANWQKAFEAKDVDGVMAMYATGDALTAFDIVPPLQYKGADAYRKDYADFFAQFDGPLHLDFRDSHVEVGAGDVGLAYGLEHLSGKLKSGKPVDIWLRYTAGLKKIDGKWRDIHDHISVPADLDSGKAMLDLKP